MPGEFQQMLDDLEDWQTDRERLEKALTWAEEEQQRADLARLQGIDREIRAKRDRDTAAMMKALSPSARQSRAEQMREAFDLSDITEQLEAMAPGSTDRSSRTIAKALPPSYFIEAWRVLTAAEAAGEATPDVIAKAASTLHTKQFESVLDNVREGDFTTARAHLRVLAPTGAFASAEQAAKIEYLVNKQEHPAVNEVVPVHDWNMIPPAAHQHQKS